APNQHHVGGHALTTDRSMCPKDLITERREDQALTPKNAALLLRRDQSFCEKRLDWDRPVTEVLSLITYPLRCLSIEEP
ncbi:hypothetical protein ACEWPL_017905, partial [Roseovarius sp. S1116L3]|uniref:hypothetical protein n=1 Tax=Roseovarius roseus TaxID=3342636 RepID=UPI003B67D49D